MAFGVGVAARLVLRGERVDTDCAWQNVLAGLKTASRQNYGAREGTCRKKFSVVRTRQAVGKMRNGNCATVGKMRKAEICRMRAIVCSRESIVNSCEWACVVR